MKKKNQEVSPQERVQLMRNELWYAMQHSIWHDDTTKMQKLMHALEAFIDAKIQEQGK
jgi:hypothetical protein